MAFGFGFVRRVLHGFRDPHDLGRGLAKDLSRLAPLESDESVRRLFEDLHFFDAADGIRGILDVGDFGPDRVLGAVYRYLCFNEHGVSHNSRVKDYR